MGLEQKIKVLAHIRQIHPTPYEEVTAQLPDEIKAMVVGYSQRRMIIAEADAVLGDGTPVRLGVCKQCDS